MTQISLLTPSEGARKVNRFRPFLFTNCFTVQASVNPRYAGSQLSCWRSSNLRTAKLFSLKNALLSRRVPLHHLSLSLLSTPVVGLAAGVVAESLITTSLPSFGVWARKRDREAAIFAPSEIVARRHQPVHLQIHSPQQALEVPTRRNP